MAAKEEARTSSPATGSAPNVVHPTSPEIPNASNAVLKSQAEPEKERAKEDPSIWKDGSWMTSVTCAKGMTLTNDWRAALVKPCRSERIHSKKTSSPWMAPWPMPEIHQVCSPSSFARWKKAHLSPKEAAKEAREAREARDALGAVVDVAEAVATVAGEAEAAATAAEGVALLPDDEEDEAAPEDEEVEEAATTEAALLKVVIDLKICHVVLRVNRPTKVVLLKAATDLRTCRAALKPTEAAHPRDVIDLKICHDVLRAIEAAAAAALEVEAAIVLKTCHAAQLLRLMHHPGLALLLCRYE